MSRQKYSDEELLDEIRRLADGDDPPTKAEMDEHGEYWGTTYQRRFGSWINAIEEALDKEVADRVRDNPKGGNHISDEELLEELRRLADGNDPPTATEMKEEGEYSATTYRRRFESWEAAVREALGEEAAAKANNRAKASDEELLEEIRRLTEDGEPPTQADMIHDGEYSAAIYKDHFGSWSKAIGKALGEEAEAIVASRPGSPPPSKEKVLEEIRRLADDDDDPPTLSNMIENSDVGASWEQHFDSWQEAVREAIGDDAAEVVADRTTTTSRIPDEDLLDEIRRLADELGKRPTQAEMERDGKYASTTYTRRFGKWSAALDKALGKENGDN